MTTVRIPARRPFAAAPADEDKKPSASPAPMSNRWKGVIGVEGTPTGDGRLIEPSAIRWDAADFPMPLRMVFEDVGAHQGAQVVGRILGVSRNGGDLEGYGDFDLGSDIGQEAMRQVSQGLCNGVSMDLDDIAFEYRVPADSLSEMEDDGYGDDLFFASRDGGIIDDEPDPDPGSPAGEQLDSEGRVTLFKFSPGDEMEVTTGARLRAATIVSLPAFASAKIAMDPDGDGDDDTSASGDTDHDYVEPDGSPGPKADDPSQQPEDGAEREEDKKGKAKPAHALSAAAAPADRDRPPAAWFADPGLTEPTALRITADGRVLGHLAEWGTCHTGFADRCVTPPRSRTGYAHFRTGYVVTREGTEIPVGHLTCNTGHAGPSLGAAAALAHYDNTGAAFADVAAGEDDFGIWIAGALRPGLTAARVREVRASPLSGDWRQLGGSLELVAALSVNVPGFPVPRTSGMVASGRMVTLVASGMVPPKQVLPPGAPGALSTEDLRYLKRLADRERDRQHAEARSLAARVSAPAREARRERAAALALAVLGRPKFADVDNGPWDGDAAMDACHSAADFRSVCAGERKSEGTPDEKQHWALPHHSAPGDPPNAKGVASALGYLDRTDGIDKDAARKHLEDHENGIHHEHPKEK